jgi:hypothetical protein
MGGERETRARAGGEEVDPRIPPASPPDRPTAHPRPSRAQIKVPGV